MGNWNSGRRPQPSKLKILRGNPGKRKINPAEPQPLAVDDTFDRPPVELAGDRRARAEWRRAAPLLRACGLVTVAERASLTALCQQWSRYLEAQEQIRSAGMITTGAGGVLVTSPYIAIADKALSQCHRLWATLGLTPSGRARIGAAGVTKGAPASSSKWAGLL